ncbi:MAG: mRNA surveillance protein pelota [Candidatus Woesearchaeota archaeon]|nr:mRNA surveillance protein pelota [Candidatus Woesearchaeota archaeon]
MRMLFSDFKNGEVKLAVDNIDDLWYLSTLIDKGDEVKGQTYRKIKYGEKEKAERKKVFLKIKVEKIDFNPGLNTLKILGTIIEGTEDVPRGQHHSFDIGEGTTITIKKEKWFDFQKKRLEEASKQKFTKTLIVVFDREEAYFAVLKKFGYDVIAKLKGEVSKKGYKTEKEKNFYEEIINSIKEYDKERNFDNIVLASPAFWKEELIKSLKDELLKKKIILATCSSCDEKAIDEVIKRPEVNLALKKERLTKELKLVDELMIEISKNGLYAYGLREVEESAKMGCVRELLITDKFMQDKKEKGEYSQIEAIIKEVERNKGETHIISSEHDGGKKLDGLGGIAAILRFRFEI